MYSKTKTVLARETIDKIMHKAELGEVRDFSPLGDGMFNAVYNVVTDREYVLKVAPLNDIPVMTYEMDMLKTEVYWYNKIAETTTIKTPEIYYFDNSHDIINADWFVMEKLGGVHRNKIDLPKDEIITETARMIAEIHNVCGEKFGYVQNGLYDNWYLAYRSMVVNMLGDLKRVGKHSRRGEKLLNYVDKYKNILAKAPCTMVNYDLWDSNVLCCRVGEKVEFSWIDPERSMWGDPVLDFLCLENFTSPIDKKSLSIKVHNEYCDIKIEPTNDVKIRFAFALGLMGLIQETEKFYRFKLFGEGWNFDVTSSRFCYNAAFKVLKNGR